MSLPSTSIKRPVLASVFSITLVLFGVIGYYQIGLRDYPSVDPPIITVTTTYTGANSEVMISQVTEPLEESINGIDGIRTVTSVSSDGRSNITVEFGLDVDLEAAANDVRDRVSRAQRRLPPDTDPPIVNKADANAEAIISLKVLSPNRDLLSLTEIGNNLFKERLQTINGVSEVQIWGEKRFAMRLKMDPDRMAALGITPSDVREALEGQNVELPSGRIEGSNTELTIRTDGRLTTEEDFNNMIIRQEGGSIIRFRDIGKAHLAAQNERSLLRGDGAVPMIGIAITPQPGANYIDIADEFYRRLEVIQKDIPEDLIISINHDNTIQIRAALKEVRETIFIAFGLVVLVIFFFLRNWRSTLIPVIAIPISLISTFFIMYISGFSINVLTLLGIVLGTGLVVDDAIVVLENIYQKVEAGMKPREAAFQGSKEIFFAVISTTVTLVAVFLPIMFLEGITGRLFREFGVVVAGAVVISSFVSLSLTPMMSSRLLKKGANEGRFYKRTEKHFIALTSGYERLLGKFMTVRWLAIVLMLGSVAMIFFIGRTLKSELAPMEDRSRFVIRATAPEGTSFNYMNDFLAKLIYRAEEEPETQSILSVTSPGFGAVSAVNTGFIRVNLVEPSERTRTQSQIVDDLGMELRNSPEARVFLTQDPTIGDRRGGLPVQYVVQANSLEKIKDIVEPFMEMAQSSALFAVVDVDVKFNKPEFNVQIDRERARDLGVSVRDVAETLQLYFSDQRIGYFILRGRQYEVIAQAEDSRRDDPLDMRTAFVRNDRGEMVQLDNLIRISEISTPPQQYRYNRYASATFSANPAPKVSLGEGIAEMERIAAEVLDETYTTELAGQSRDFDESSRTLLFAFFLALVLVYLTLAAQFESWFDPLIVMFTVPLAIAGAVLALWLTDSTLNIFSQIGIIMLIGIVTKNGILIVEFANQRRNEGLELLPAIIDASASRLRPILMTSFATILGALPIALALGASAQSRTSMGIAVIGGLLFSLLLTLFVIPALYAYMSRRKTVYNDGDF